MAAVLIAIAFGGIGGCLSGGRFGNLGYLRLRAWPLLFAPLAVQLVLGSAPRDVRGLLAVMATAAVGGWFLLNRGLQPRVGPLLVAGGTILNAAVIAANAGMPVSRRALTSAGLSPSTNVARGHLYKHVMMTGGSHLRFLGDVIPFRPDRMVLSPGDLGMLAGIALIVWAGCHAVRPADRQPEPVTSLAEP